MKILKFKYLMVFLLLSANVFAQSTFSKYFAEGQDAERNGFASKAIEYYQKAEKATKKNFEKNRVWKALADNYKQQSDYNHAIDYYTKLLTVYNDENRKTVLLNLSDLWILTGQYQKVIDNLKDMQKAPDESIRLTNLSSAYTKLGKFDEALKLLDAVLMDTKSKAYNIALQNKGYILWAQSRFQMADSILKIAVSMFNENDSKRYICLGNLAKVQAELKKYDDALKNIDAALDWQKKNLGEKHLDYVISLRKKAEILLASGKTGDATRQFKDYFYKERDYIATNFAFMSENERLNFWYSQKPLVDECYMTESLDPDFLFDVAVFSKSVLSLANDNFAAAAFNDNKMKEVYTQIITLKSDMIAAKPSERPLIQTKIDGLEKQFAEMNPKFKKFVSDLKIDRQRVSQSLKNPNDAVVEFIYYKNNDEMRYAALVLQKNVPVKFIPLFSQSEIEDHKIKGLSVSLRINSSRASYKNGLFTDTLMSEKIWKKIVDYMPLNSNLYFVPDGIFYNLGIEYMCFWRPDLHFYRLTSSAIITKSATRKNQTALIAGGFDYNDASSIAAVPDSMPDRTGSIFFNSKGIHTTWKNLLSSNAEVDSVAKVLGASGIEVTKITADKGAEDILKKQMSEANIILLSTHGYFFSTPTVNNEYGMSDSFSADSSMTACGLVFSGVNKTSQDKPENQFIEDGCLTGFEISTLDLSKADLIVLSACSTGLGEISLSGTSGIVRGLKKAGANSAIVSLWEVNDAATRLLMTYFFDFLNTGMSKYDAFCAAREKLKNFDGTLKMTVQEFSQTRMANVKVEKEFKPDFSNPYFWAPFVLIDGI
ncbi:MAG: CHAT domain-containing protein [Bacteroidales bacterium]|nr:CHAT domain-containing protein [Bacteroidales bacterium]